MSDDAQNRPQILPTYEAFDDVVTFMASPPPGVAAMDCIIVHAVLCASDGQRRHAHAWVEQHAPRGAPSVWQGGIYQGERIWWALPLDVFEQSYDVRYRVRYTLAQALMADAESKNGGPWDPHIRSFCREDAAALGRIDTITFGGDGPQVNFEVTGYVVDAGKGGS